MRFLSLLWRGALITALLALCGCTPKQDPTRLLLGGDVFLARGGEPIFTSGENPWGDFLAIRMKMEDSFFVVNLESPIGVIPEDQEAEILSMNLCAPAESVNVLVQGEVNLVTTANNHAQDCEGSRRKTSEVLNLAGIKNAGKQGEIIYQKIAGGTVSFVTLNDYSEPYDLDWILSQIKLAEQNSQLVVVSIHWGQEYQVNPTTHQKDLAGQLVNAGADIVWGHHPHVLQPIQWLQSTENGHEALVLYSVGNLLSDQYMLADALRSVVVNIEWNQHKIRKVNLIPVEMDFQSKSLQVVSNEDELAWWKDRLNLDNLEKGNAEIILGIPEGS